MQIAALLLPKNSVGLKKKTEPIKAIKEVKKTSFKKMARPYPIRLRLEITRVRTRSFEARILRLHLFGGSRVFVET